WSSDVCSSDLIVAFLGPIGPEAADDAYLRDTLRLCAEGYAGDGRLLNRPGSDSVALAIALLRAARSRCAKAIVILPRHGSALRPQDAGQVDIGWSRGKLLVFRAWAHKIFGKPDGNDVSVL